MAFIEVPDTAQVTIRMAQFGQIVVNTLCFTKTGGFSGTDLADLAEAVADWWGTRISPIVSVSCVLTAIEARDISEESGAVSEYFPPSAVSGQLTVTELPTNVTWAIQFKTGLAGRSFRGRNYIVGLQEDQTIGNQLSGAVAASFLAAYVALNSDINEVLAATHVVVSRFHDNAPRPTGIATAVETYGYADLNLDSMRRRLTGRGT